MINIEKMKLKFGIYMLKYYRVLKTKKLFENLKSMSQNIPEYRNSKIELKFENYIFKYPKM